MFTNHNLKIFTITSLIFSSIVIYDGNFSIVQAQNNQPQEQVDNQEKESPKEDKTESNILENNSNEQDESSDEKPLLNNEEEENNNQTTNDEKIIDTIENQEVINNNSNTNNGIYYLIGTLALLIGFGLLWWRIQKVLTRLQELEDKQNQIRDKVEETSNIVTSQSNLQITDRITINTILNKLEEVNQHLSNLSVQVCDINSKVKVQISPASSQNIDSSSQVERTIDIPHQETKQQQQIKASNTPTPRATVNLTNISGDKVSLTKETIDNVWKGVTSRIEFALDDNGEYLVNEGDKGINYLYLNPSSRITPEAVRMWKKAKLFSVKGNQNTTSFKIESMIPARVIKSSDGWIFSGQGEVTFA